jgi:hypothetical protein
MSGDMTWNRNKKKPWKFQGFYMENKKPGVIQLSRDKASFWVSYLADPG